MTRYELSQRTGQHQSHIKNIEVGVNDPSVTTLARLLRGLDVTLEEFFSGKIKEKR
jgi:transcriptional regulator with XRE-family HTH domain